MKKHIFGAALFSFIVASFAFIYAFLYAPSIPSKEAVKPPISRTETRVEKPNYCRLSRKKLSVEVLSSQYLIEENKIVSKIRVTLNNFNSIPSKIHVTTTFSSFGSEDGKSFGDYNIIENPFAEGMEKIVTVVSNVSNGSSLKRNENLYISASVTDSDSSNNYKRGDEFTETKAVLFVYGKSNYDLGSVNKGRSFE